MPTIRHIPFVVALSLVVSLMPIGEAYPIVKTKKSEN
jgi:hypothetical protein